MKVNPSPLLSVVAAVGLVDKKWVMRVYGAAVRDRQTSTQPALVGHVGTGTQTMGGDTLHSPSPPDQGTMISVHALIWAEGVKKGEWGREGC